MVALAVVVDTVTKRLELEQHHPFKVLMVLLVQRLVHLFQQAVAVARV